MKTFAKKCWTKFLKLQFFSIVTRPTSIFVELLINRIFAIGLFKTQSKVTVWCTVSQFRVIGPYFFEDMVTSSLSPLNGIFHVDRIFWTWTGSIEWRKQSGRHPVPTIRGYIPYILNFNGEIVTRAPGLCGVTWCDLHAHYIRAL